LTIELSEKGKLQRFKEIFKGIIAFLKRWYVWSGLLIGFLWAFPAPFVLELFDFFKELPQLALWIIFLPLQLSFQLTHWIVDLEFADPVSWILILWIISVLIGMSLGVAFMYFIHRIRNWRNTRKLS